MTPMQYADYLNEYSCKVTDVYDKATLNDIFIEGVDPSIFQSLWKYWATHPQVYVTVIAFKAQSL